MSTQDLGRICYGGWAELTDGNSGRARAEVAQLRRAVAPVDVLTHAATHRLHRALLSAGIDLRVQPQRLALLVMVLAHVKTSGRGLAQVLGQGDPPAYSTLRFDRLIRTDAQGDGAADLAQQLRRALAQVKHEANVSTLARDLYWWSDQTRARWCFDYYGAGEAAPDFSQETSDKITEEQDA
jgi:CRISPR system Cascade subunit CasB